MRGSRGARRGVRRLLVVAAAAAWLLSMLLSAPGGVAGAGTRYSRSGRTVTEGLRFIKITDSYGPNNIRVLKVDPSSPLTMDVALSNNEIPLREETTSMAARHGAIAAINGAMGWQSGRPHGLFAEDGALKTSEEIWGVGFAISRDERRIYMDHPVLKIGVINPTTMVRWEVDAWNPSKLKWGLIAGYNDAGGSLSRPPEDACSVRLLPRSQRYWGERWNGIVRNYVIDKARCSSRRMLRRGGIVLSARMGTRLGARLDAAIPGQIVRLRWAIGWTGVTDVMPANVQLLDDRAVVVEACSEYFCRDHPRTGVGVTATGKLLLVTVDGRQTGFSVGMTPPEFARLFKYLGAVDAVNLDGGGSTTMVLKGRIVNSPSEGDERWVNSAVLVLPGNDPGEPVIGAPRPLTY